MALKMKADVLRAAFAKLRVCLIEKTDDNGIAEELGLSWEDVQELKRRFHDHESEIVRARSTEHTYIRYVIEQRQNLHDLDEIIKDYEKQKNVAAIVSAIRAKSEILENILKTGQELGLVERLSKGEGFHAGEALKQLNNVQFRDLIVNVIADLDGLRLRFGDKSITEMTTGPLHRPLPAPKQAVKGHSRSKVHAGRRVVKGGKSS